MYRHHITDMVNKLVLEGVVAHSKKKKAMKLLEGYWEDKIAVSWEVADVKQIAKENGRSITDEDAKDVLATVLDNYDANVGINWDVLFQNLPEKK